MSYRWVLGKDFFKDKLGGADTHSLLLKSPPCPIHRSQ